jgi:hypothetical protein
MFLFIITGHLPALESRTWNPCERREIVRGFDESPKLSSRTRISRELQKYRSLRKDVHATYVMIGTPPSRYGFDSDPSMEIDEEAVRRWDENTGGKAVQERLMLLVSEDELEGESSVRRSAF